MKGLTAKQLKDFGFFDMSLEQQMVWLGGYMYKLVNGLLRDYEGMAVAIANGLGIQNYNTVTPPGGQPGTAKTSFTGTFLHEIYDTTEAPYKSVSAFIPDIEIETSKSGNNKSSNIIIESEVEAHQDIEELAETLEEKVELPPQEKTKTARKSKPKTAETSTKTQAFEGSKRGRKPKSTKADEGVKVAVTTKKPNPLLS